MSHIKSRKHPIKPRKSVSSLSSATLLTGMALSLPIASIAHAADDAAAPTGKAVELQKMTVVGEDQSGYKEDQVSSPKFTQPLQDTPQTIQIITSDLFNQQGATTLTEALRNSPGVGTFYFGENGSTSTGDSVYMRGFDTSSSLFVDGVRDLGSISRDVFNIEQIEVEKGPAGTDNGRSAPTGAINLVSKQAMSRNAASGTVSGGVDGQKRATADLNHGLDGIGGGGLRLNLLWQDSDEPGRDHVKNKRWGIAPAFSAGLDTGTRYYLNALYVDQNNVPDGGVPTIGLPHWEPQDGLEALAGHPVDSSNFYGTKSDHDDVKAGMATFKIEHDLSDNAWLTNTARWGQTKQDYLLTSFMASNSTITYTDADDLSTYVITRSLPTFKDIKNTILTDQLNLRVDFSTGRIKHNLSAGLEATKEKQKSVGEAATDSTSWPAANLYDPDWDVTGLTWGRNGTDSDGSTTTYSAYAFDTLTLTKSLLITGGIRVDDYKTDYLSTVACGGTGRRAVSCPTGVDTGTIITKVDATADDTLFNWKLGAVYKFGDLVSAYANYAISLEPPGGDNFELSDSDSSADNPDMDPQKSKTAEIGTKWALLGDALALDIAAYQTKVTNEVLEQEDGTVTQDGQKSVKGVEVSLVGNITERWSVSAGYSDMKTKVDEGSTVTADGSYNLTYTPDYSFTSWTTYKFDSGLTVGGGVRYMDGLHRGSDSAEGTPSTTDGYTVIDAVASYAFTQNFTLRLNAYNLTDKDYVASINKSGYRYTPGTPRTFLATADFRF